MKKRNKCVCAPPPPWSDPAPEQVLDGAELSGVWGIASQPSTAPGSPTVVAVACSTVVGAAVLVALEALAAGRTDEGDASGGGGMLGGLGLGGGGLGLGGGGLGGGGFAAFAAAALTFASQPLREKPPWRNEARLPACIAPQSLGTKATRWFCRSKITS